MKILGVLDQTAIAYGTFDDTLNSTGWGVLDIVGQEISGLSIDQAFYATGILEGNFAWNSESFRNEPLKQFKKPSKNFKVFLRLSESPKMPVQ